MGEQFLHWFLQEQREEVASMTELLNVVELGKDNLLAGRGVPRRNSGGEENPLEQGAPPAAGGAL